MNLKKSKGVFIWWEKKGSLGSKKAIKYLDDLDENMP